MEIDTIPITQLRLNYIHSFKKMHLHIKILKIFSQINQLWLIVHLPLNLFAFDVFIDSIKNCKHYKNLYVLCKLCSGL